MHLRRSRLAAALATTLVAVLAAPSAQAFTLYDDFTATSISPSRWSGEEHTQFGATMAEARRVVGSGQLRIEAKGYSDSKTNTGIGRVRNQAGFGNSSTVTAMKATITPRTVSFVNCAGNTSPSAVRFRLVGSFFNAGVPDANSQYNDVIAGVQVYRLSNSADAAGVMKVSGFVAICTDSQCIGSNTVSTVDLTGASGAAVGTATTVSITWDKTNHQFVFQKDADATQSIVYTLSDTSRSTYYGKRMEVTDDIANCTATRASAYGGADFDNVYVNP